MEDITFTEEQVGNKLKLTLTSGNVSHHIFLKGQGLEDDSKRDGAIKQAKEFLLRYTLLKQDLAK